MAIKILGIAAMALACSVGICAAQQATPTPPSDELLAAMQAVMKSAPKSAPGAAPAIATGAVGPNGSQAAYSIGWYYQHPYNCYWYYDSSGNEWYWVITYEGYSWGIANNIYTETAETTQCANGNWSGWYVYNTSGNWSQFLTYNYH
jgi:hypothetical protein